LHSYSCLLRSVFPFEMFPRCSFNLEHYLEIWRGDQRCSGEQNIFFLNQYLSDN